MSSDKTAPVVDTAIATISIDLSTPFGTRYSSDSEDYEPVTLGSELLDRLERRLFEGFAAEANKMLQAALAERIKDAAEQLVAEAIAKPVQQTNSWGEPTGKETTLRDAIHAEVQKWLTSSNSNSYDRNNKQNLAGLIEQAVHKVMANEMAEVIKGEKTKLIGVVREQGAKVLAETLRRAVAS